MTPGLIRKMGGKTRWRVIEALKWGGGCCVQDLAGQLGMSYMGVKEVCVALEKNGLLKTWRQPSTAGRPRLEYRLTERAQQLFPAETHGIALELLESANALFGNAAAEKLLLVLFKRLGERYARRLRPGNLEDRARRLVEIRSAEGYLSRWEQADAGSQDASVTGGSQQNGMPAGRWTEAHSPIAEVLRAYPIAARLETEMLGNLIGGRVVRREDASPSIYRCEFLVYAT
jgi:predicted ArsR family transcriptional regulator